MVLAILAGAAAVVLLLAGLGLTVDGLHATEQAAGRAPGAAPGGSPGGSSSGLSSGSSSGSFSGSPSGSVPDRAAPGPPDPTDAGRGKGRPGDGQAREPSTADGAGPDRVEPAEDPAAALVGLAAVRARAFAEADPDLLTRVDVGGSPAMSADREAVEALAGTGRILRDLSIDIRAPAALTDAERAGLPALAGLAAVTDPPPSTEVSLVRATAALSSYIETLASAPQQSAPQRSAPEPLMAAGQQELIFILWSSPGGWRIHSVVAAPP